MPLESIAKPARSHIEKELDRLVKEGTLEPVEFSEWALPMVAVLKPDKTKCAIMRGF